MWGELTACPPYHGAIRSDRSRQRGSESAYHPAGPIPARARHDSASNPGRPTPFPRRGDVAGGPLPVLDSHRGGGGYCVDASLEWLRWRHGFTCPDCGQGGGWRMGDGRFKCIACGSRTSVTAGTIFDRTRTPLTVWFGACWMFATAKDGVSAMNVKRVLEIGSYQTAWAMLHRIRSVLVRQSAAADWRGV